MLGSAVAINLLTHNHIPIFWAVIITASDVLLLLALQRYRHAHDRSRRAGARRHDRRFATSLRSSSSRQTKPDLLEIGLSLLTPGFRQAWHA